MSRRTVLIVDDNAEFRQLARPAARARRLRGGRGGRRRRRCPASPAALRPDIVLLDVQLPDLDGFAIAETLAADVDPPVVVLISSRDRGAYRFKLAATSARAFLPKGELTCGPSIRRSGHDRARCAGRSQLPAGRPEPAPVAEARTTRSRDRVLWFAGDLFAPLVFAHRAPVTHLLLLYPAARFSHASVPDGGVVYTASLVYPIGQLASVTVLSSLRCWSRLSLADPRRRRRPAVLPARQRGGCARLGPLAAPRSRVGPAHTSMRLSWWRTRSGCSSLGGVVTDDRYRRSRATIVTNLAIDLGATGARSLRDVVAERSGARRSSSGCRLVRGSPTRAASRWC